MLSLGFPVCWMKIVSDKKEQVLCVLWCVFHLCFDGDDDWEQVPNTVEPVLATTWQKRPPENCGHTISVPLIRGFKCTECVFENATTWQMRIADTEGRPKASIQPAKSDHMRQIGAKNTFWLPNFPSQALRTSDLRVFKLRLAFSLPPLTRGYHLSLMSWLAQGHVYNSILKISEPNLANETTWKIGPLYPPSLRWSYFPGLTVTRSLVAWSPAGLLWKTKAPKLLSDWTSASISEKVNISWGQRSIDAIKPV